MKYFKRDLLKLFERLSGIHDGDDRRTLLLYLNDIYDCFFLSIQNSMARTELAINAGFRFHINKEEVVDHMFDI